MSVQEQSLNRDQKAPVKITEIGHATMLIQFRGVTILTDPWFTDPILGVVTHACRLRTQVKDLPKLDLILITHGHFDHCDLRAMSECDKSCSIIVPDAATANRVAKIGFTEVIALDAWQSKKVAGIDISAFPAEHPAPERTYVLSDGGCNVFFGGDTRYVKEMKDIGERFDISVAMLPVNGLSLPFMGKVAMDPIDAAEAAVQLKARVVIPIHYNISLTIPGLKRIFERSAPGTPELFIMEMRKRNRHIKVVPLKPGQSWENQ